MTRTGDTLALKLEERLVDLGAVERHLAEAVRLLGAFAKLDPLFRRDYHIAVGIELHEAIVRALDAPWLHLHGVARVAHHERARWLRMAPLEIVQTHAWKDTANVVRALLMVTRVHQGDAPVPVGEERAS